MIKKILGVKIDDVSMEEATLIITKWLDKIKDTRYKIQENNSPKLIFTPGPEFLVTAQSDGDFKKILNDADLSVPDGFGLHLAGAKNRVPGVELMLALCEMSAVRGWRIGMIGGPNTSLAAGKLLNSFPKLQISYAIDNPRADKVLKSSDSLRSVDILFVGVGHPKQEKFLWICRLKHKFRVGMGVGGSFDFISGQVWEPGKWFRRLGLKWLGRLLANPGHFGRVVRATVIFPLLLLKEKLGF